MERAEEQLKPEGNKSSNNGNEKATKTRIEGNKNPLREMHEGREILELKMDE